MRARGHSPVGSAIDLRTVASVSPALDFLPLIHCSPSFRKSWSLQWLLKSNAPGLKGSMLPYVHGSIAVDVAHTFMRIQDVARHRALDFAQEAIVQLSLHDEYVSVRNIASR